MTEQIDPKQYGLSSRVKLFREQDSIIIVKKRKSRIIMKDSMLIVDIVSTIRSHENNMVYKLLIEGPICSKSKAFLLENNVEVIVDL